MYLDGHQFGGSAYLLSQMVCRGHPDTLADEVIEVVPRASCDITLDFESRKPGVASNPQVGRPVGCGPRSGCGHAAPVQGCGDQLAPELNRADEGVMGLAPNSVP